MQDHKNRQASEREAKKAERLAEALRANLAKRKALARAKKAGAAETSDRAAEVPLPEASDEQDADAS
jgi:hypothetical protein